MAMGRLVGDSDEIRKLITFEGCEHDLLRGSSLYKMLSRAGAVLRTSTPSALSYTKSEPVQELDLFLSHNWNIWRIFKYLALSLHYNRVYGVVAAIAVAMLWRVIDMMGYYPGPFFGEGLGIMCRLTIIPVFALVLFITNDVKARFGFPGPAMFLDKTCIHQTDKAKQREGILRLGAFLYKSKEMVVLYSECYLEKLWTVYEVACFLTTRSPKEMTIVSLYQSAVFFAGLIIIYVLQFVDILILYVKFPDIRKPIVFSTYMLTIRVWAQEKAKIMTRIDNFSVRKCRCFCEDDRPIVYTNIANLIRAMGIAPNVVDLEGALDAFDEHVRGNIKDAFRPSLGHLSMKYVHITTLALLFYLGSNVDTSWRMADISLRGKLINLERDLLSAFANMPCVFFVGQLVMSCKTHLRGWRNVLWSIFGFLSSTATGWVQRQFQPRLISWAHESNWGLVCMLLYDALICAIATAIFTDRLWELGKKKLAGAEEQKEDASIAKPIGHPGVDKAEHAGVGDDSVVL